MIYQLLVLFNSILFFLVPVFAPNGDPKITTNIPSTMVIDQEAVLEIKISKSQITGFATFQMDLPEGFIPREIENAEATCSINEGQIIWTWTTLPEEEEFSISIGITPNASALGKKTLGASLYYIENNEKRSTDLTPLQITVLKEGETEPALSSTENPGNGISPVESHSEPAGLVEVLKTLVDGNTADEKKIDITIKKGITKGFARYSDNLEEGFTAKAVKTDGSSFSIADGKIKFVWVTVPEKEELNVSYILVRKSTMAELLLKGEYSYLEHNQSKKAVAPEQTIRFSTSNTPTLVNSTDNKAPKKTTSTENTDLKEKQTTEVQSQLEKQSKQQQQTTRFAIQVGAFTNQKVSAQTLKRKFKLTQNLRSEYQEGYSKFMFGAYDEYKSARAQREKAVSDNGVKSAFVVAYNNGKRITVQEALMIVNQKWFK
ncbi:MAG: SPOR domain-containing protein [Bacteroidia bacterium]|jgi:cell division septation protein DedD|nr:SPOR domain-containing protein [Bacteroidia bacterium]